MEERPVVQVYRAHVGHVSIVVMSMMIAVVGMIKAAAMARNVYLENSHYVGLRVIPVVLLLI